ncbi:hypothetical protein [Mucisphaera sp.]|uniref:hypothetical protein n=1 Tax=Mucisphaera sp. TaxID=2913024 RepID=UPI003D099BF2
MRFIAGLLILTALAMPALADEFVHEANVMARLGNQPTPTQILTNAPFIIDVEIVRDPVGGSSPLYEDKNTVANNPLYEPEGAADPGSTGSIQSISFIFDNTALTPYLHSEGIIHRDIAARNFVANTSFGIYASADEQTLLFSSRAPFDVTASETGSITWITESTLRLDPINPLSDDDFIEIAAGTSFSVNYATPIPEPASAALLLLATGLTRRR